MDVDFPGAGERTGRILLVDDDPDLCQAYSRILRRSGCVVVLAHSGEQAIAALDAGRFDLIIADINMSEMSGIQFLRTVRERDLNLPVVLMTGDPSLETAMEATDLGAYRYLNKPVSFSLLTQLAGTAVHRHVVATILGEDVSLADACHRVVAATCDALGWDVGTTWLPIDADHLGCAETWTNAPLGTAEFEAANLQTKVEAWRGLPGRVWAGGCPEWVASITGDDQLRRSQFALSAGLRSAVAVPVAAEGEVFAVLEFFSRVHRAPNFPMLNLLATSANQLGAHFRRQQVSNAETKLADSQQLASVGRLATGVAHEVNTPVQFVNDSVEFLRDAAAEVFAVLKQLQHVRELASAVAGDGPLRSAVDRALEYEARADLPYLEENIPKAFDRCLDGLQRITTIVRSMKDFAHRSDQVMQAADLNRALESTLVIARTEYKYVADLRLELGALPPVVCLVGEVNQVILNLLVNAAHAIGEVVDGTANKGTITVRTRQDGEDVVMEVSDTGVGIPPALASRIFEPFFTTKPVGKGTGQGLALARTVIEQKHGGRLTFESNPGEGTTFFVRLPTAGKPPKSVSSSKAA